MSRPKPKRSEQEKLIADLLFLRIRQSGRNMRDVSRALGEDEGELSRVLRGFKRLDFGLLYAVLAELRVPREEFFEQLHKLMPFEVEEEDRAFVSKPVIARASALRRASKMMGTMEGLVGRELEAYQAQLAAEAAAKAAADAPTEAAGAEAKTSSADSAPAKAERKRPTAKKGKAKKSPGKKSSAKKSDEPKRGNGRH